MSGRGASLQPAPNSDVALHGLHAELVFEPESETFRVSARYELRNRTAREVRLQLGLPEPRCESDDEEDAACRDPRAFRWSELETKVRDAATPMRKGALPAHHEWAPLLAGVWLFEVRLGPNEHAAVEHRYRTPAGPAAGGGMAATFVTRTDRLWAAPVDRTTVSFLIPAYSCLVVEPEQIQRRTRRVILRDGEPWLQLVYATYQWSPRSDLSLYFETCVAPRDTELAGCPLLEPLARFAYGVGPDDPTPAPSREGLKAELAKLPEAELRRCGTAVFDAYASYYSEAELAELAKRPSAARHYAAPLLTPADWQWVGIVDEVLTERARARAAPKPLPAANGGCSTLASAADGVSALPFLLSLLAAGFRSRAFRARLRAAGSRSEIRSARARAAGRSRPRVARPG